MLVLSFKRSSLSRFELELELELELKATHHNINLFRFYSDEFDWSKYAGLSGVEKNCCVCNCTNLVGVEQLLHYNHNSQLMYDTHTQIRTSGGLKSVLTDVHVYVHSGTGIQYTEIAVRGTLHESTTMGECSNPLTA